MTGSGYASGSCCFRGCPQYPRDLVESRLRRPHDLAHRPEAEDLVGKSLEAHCDPILLKLAGIGFGLSQSTPLPSRASGAVSVSSGGLPTTALSRELAQRRDRPPSQPPGPKRGRLRHPNERTTCCARCSSAARCARAQKSPGRGRTGASAACRCAGPTSQCASLGDINDAI
jgi:hypothetical protein